MTHGGTRNGKFTDRVGVRRGLVVQRDDGLNVSLRLGLSTSRRS
jgi:hypothetical protein